MSTRVVSIDWTTAAVDQQNIVDAHCISAIAASVLRRPRQRSRLYRYKARKFVRNIRKSVPLLDTDIVDKNSALS
jgi:hypothetical protein